VLRQQLGIFLRLPDGAQLALWNHGRKKPAVVYLGSGELENVAPDFESFLIALSRRTTGVSDLDDEAASAKRDALAKWLLAHDVRSSRATIPSFRDWFTTTVERHRAPRIAPPVAAGSAPTDLIERAERLIGRPIDDPALLALARELGFDLSSIHDADQLHDLARPEEGFTLDVAFPWDYPSVAQEYPAKKRKGVARVLWGIKVCADKYKEWSNGTRDYNRYQGFRGVLPKGLSFKDDVKTARAKLGSRRIDHDTLLVKSLDREPELEIGVSFAFDDSGELKKGRMQYISVHRRRS
jgi:hypothetical protein